MSRKKENGVITILRYRGWVIARDRYNYLFYHIADTKRNYIRYPGSLSSALALLHEQLLLSRVRSEGYISTLEGLRKAVEDVNKEFEQLLSPRIVERIKNEK